MGTWLLAAVWTTPLSLLPPPPYHPPPPPPLHPPCPPLPLPPPPQCCPFRPFAHPQATSTRPGTAVRYVSTGHRIANA
eukprot:3809311-Rhodomonas_salina.3